MSAGRLRLFPLNTVLFPGASLQLHVFEPRYKQMISECLDDGEAFGVCLIREGDEAGDPAVDPHEIGTTAEISDVTPLPLGRLHITTCGKRRFKITNIISREPYLLCEVEYLEDRATNRKALDELRRQLTSEFNEYLRLLVEYSGAKCHVEIPEDAVSASYVVGDALQVADGVKQRLLEIGDAADRLRVEIGFLRRLLPQLRAMLERKHAQPQPERNDPPGGEFRSQQERYFGKAFSNN